MAVREKMDLEVFADKVHMDLAVIVPQKND